LVVIPKTGILEKLAHDQTECADNGGILLEGGVKDGRGQSPAGEAEAFPENYEPFPLAAWSSAIYYYCEPQAVLIRRAGGLPAILLNEFCAVGMGWFEQLFCLLPGESQTIEAWFSRKQTALRVSGWNIDTKEIE
jgi:hypothetical protein